MNISINSGSVYDDDFTLLGKIKGLERRIKALEENGGGGGGSYTLPTASPTVKGGIKVGSGLQMDGETLNATGGGSYELPVASDTTLGGIKVGQGLGINSYGYLYVQGGGGGGDIPVATDEILGGVKIGNGIYAQEDGTIRSKEMSPSMNWLLSQNVGYNRASEGFLLGFARGFSIIDNESCKEYTTPLTFVNVNDDTDTKTLYLQNLSYPQYYSFVPLKKDDTDVEILINNNGKIYPPSGRGGLDAYGNVIPYLFDTVSQENAEPVIWGPEVTLDGGIYIGADSDNNNRYYIRNVWGDVTQITGYIDDKQYRWSGYIAYSNLFNTGTNILIGLDGYWLRNQIPTS